MKAYKLILFPALVAGIISCGGEKKEEQKADKTANKETAKTDVEEVPMEMPDSATMAKCWADYMTPGEMHAMIAKYDGNWEEETTMWMDPAKPPVKNKATCVNKMIMGGRYQQSVHSGSFNGMPFEGISTLAYDNAKKKFISTWIDNLGSGIMVMEGDWDAATNTMNFSGTSVDPSTGRDMKVRETMQMIDNDHQKMEMFMVMGKDEMKTMEISFTRKK